MKLVNVEKKGSLETMYGETLDIICDLMSAAVRDLASFRECEGLFTLWACPDNRKRTPRWSGDEMKKENNPVKQIEFETIRRDSEKSRMSDEYHRPVKKYGNKSCRKILDEAIQATHEATCKFFPSGYVPLTLNEKKHPLTTGYYYYLCGHKTPLYLAGPMVMVLRTSKGVFYAGFVANAFDDDAKNSAHFSIYLFSALVNILYALSSEDDEMLELGIAELLDVPKERPKAFWPSKDSSLDCFDSIHYPVAFTNIDACTQMGNNFREEVERRRIRVLERTGGMKIKLFAD